MAASSTSSCVTSIGSIELTRSRAQFGFLENAAQQIGKFNARRKVASVAAQIDSAQHDLLRAHGYESLNLRDHFISRQTAASATHKRNHAIRAAIVASVLNLQCGTRVAAFAASDGSQRDGIQRKYVPGKDFGARIERSRFA